MVYHDAPYLALLQHIVDTGEVREDRTGTGTVGVFGAQMRFDLQKGFPLLTTKRVWWKGVVEELLWMLRGETNIESLVKAGVRIWDEWANPSGELGPVYGKQWRRWQGVEGHIDQIDRVLNDLVENPFSRRHIVSAWNPADLDRMALSPCHALFQFHVSKDNRLSCQLYQRSADMLLGVPFNIASYSLLTHMIASLIDLEVGDFIWTGGDCHIYLNHLEQVKEQLSRQARPSPTLKITPGVRTIDTFVFEDFVLDGYGPHPAIKGEVSV